jgi:hypothetical protein
VYYTVNKTIKSVALTACLNCISFVYTRKTKTGGKEMNKILYTAIITN